MTTPKAITVVVFSVFFYVCGGLCIFKTKMLVARAQKSYANSKLLQNYPFSSMVTKPWYPAFIRCAGVFIWLWALAFDCLVLFLGLH